MESDAGERGPLRVLVVDDDEDCRLLVRVSLELDELDVEVLEAEDGVVAVETMTATGVDVIVLDGFMPRMDGIGVVDAMREAGPPVARIPVVTFNGLGKELYWDRTELPDTFIFLDKPTTGAEIVDAVRRAAALSNP